MTYVSAWNFFGPKGVLQPQHGVQLCPSYLCLLSDDLMLDVLEIFLAACDPKTNTHILLVYVLQRPLDLGARADRPGWMNYRAGPGWSQHHLNQLRTNKQVSVEIKLISKKSKAYNILKEFKTRAKNSTSNSLKYPRLKILKLDNTKELISNKVETLLKDSSII